MRPIDADRLLRNTIYNPSHVPYITESDIIFAPTADVVERKVGKWECSDDIFEYALCSCCKWDSGEAWEYALKRFRFCPNCGAEMVDKDISVLSKGEDDG